jgi:ribosomal protein S18 acetylase RimI-like enzyme
MDLTFKFYHDGIDWAELERLFQAADLGGRAGDKLRRAFENSPVVCYVLDGGRLIGASRAITDGEYHAVIYDVAIHPEYQGRGIGRQMMEALMERLPVWRMMLVCEEDRVGFYRKLGFEEIRVVMARFDWERLYDPS